MKYTDKIFSNMATIFKGNRLVFTSPRRGMTDFATTNIFPKIRTIDLDAAQYLAVGEAVQVAIKSTQNAIASENLMHLPEIRRLAEANVKSLLSVQGMLECDSVVHGYEAAWPLPGMSEADAANAFESALKLLRLHGFAFVYCGAGELNERVQPSDEVLSNLEKATESIAPGQPESAYRLAKAIESSLFEVSDVSENFWEAHAKKLKTSLAAQGAEFLKTASLEQIEQHAGEEFAAMSSNTKAAILAVVRTPGVAVSKAN